MTINIKHDFLYNYFLKNKEIGVTLKCVIFDANKFDIVSQHVKDGVYAKAHRVFIWDLNNQSLIETIMPDMLLNNIQKVGFRWWDASHIIDITYVVREYKESSYGSFDYTPTPLDPEARRKFIGMITDSFLDKTKNTIKLLNQQIGL